MELSSVTYAETVSTKRKATDNMSPERAAFTSKLRNLALFVEEELQENL